MSNANKEDKTYDELAKMIGYKMMMTAGAMNLLGLTTLPNFIKSYSHPSLEDDVDLRDFERWLKWSLSPKNSEKRAHLYPTDFVEKKCMFLVKEAQQIFVEKIEKLEDEQ